jgi:hypothetical protein
VDGHRGVTFDAAELLCDLSHAGGGPASWPDCGQDAWLWPGQARRRWQPASCRSRRGRTRQMVADASPLMDLTMLNQTLFPKTRRSPADSALPPSTTASSPARRSRCGRPGRPGRPKAGTASSLRGIGQSGDPIGAQKPGTDSSAYGRRHVALPTARPPLPLFP